MGFRPRTLQDKELSEKAQHIVIACRSDGNNTLISTNLVFQLLVDIGEGYWGRDTDRTHLYTLGEEALKGLYNTELFYPKHQAKYCHHFEHIAKSHADHVVKASQISK